jgi:molecular chaperone DnaK (HSP70)
MFTNTADDMESLDINVYQGGSDHVKDNALIGTVHVPGLPKRPKETLDIAVTFRVSAAQLLAVKVVVKGDSFPVVEREAPFKLA